MASQIQRARYDLSLLAPVETSDQLSATWRSMTANERLVRS
jgi:hypothetical protein